ncbi:MAG: squalene--hopene cyclase, partial [Planctomycetaceae bacterium]|nr:squalene--hopene cyclase [Planctomycetaceae bacterium]
ALEEAELSSSHPAMRKAVDWLLEKEVRSIGDWSVNHPGVEPGGWFFEFRNEFYPDIDDTIMVTMALARSLDGGKNPRQFVNRLASALFEKDGDLRMVLSGQLDGTGRAVVDVERAQRVFSAIRRAVNWTKAMQCRNGGWAAFDANNDRELLTRVPFADHNAMIDPPTADITARVLEMFGRLGLDHRDGRFESAVQFVWDSQESDGCWYGRWGVNYLYGTWQVLVGMTEFGIPSSDPRLQAGARWLIDKQQSDGGWGETPETYDRPELRGTGPTTASQTAWALMGLMAAGHVGSEAVRRGIDYLRRNQSPDGTWEEPWYTGTGFPRVFYLRYHLYRHYFPLMALARYRRLTR